MSSSKEGPVFFEAPDPLYLFVFTQFRTQNRRTPLPELL